MVATEFVAEMVEIMEVLGDYLVGSEEVEDLEKEEEGAMVQ